MFCPVCGSGSVSEANGPQTLREAGINGEDLVVTVPVGRCKDCKFEWTDYRAEGIRDEATLPMRQHRGEAVMRTTTKYSRRTRMAIVIGGSVATWAIVIALAIEFGVVPFTW